MYFEFGVEIDIEVGDAIDIERITIHTKELNVRIVDGYITNPV